VPVSCAGRATHCWIGQPALRRELSASRHLASAPRRCLLCTKRPLLNLLVVEKSAKSAICRQIEHQVRVDGEPLATLPLRWEKEERHSSTARTGWAPNSPPQPAAVLRHIPRPPVPNTHTPEQPRQPPPAVSCPSRRVFWNLPQSFEAHRNKRACAAHIDPPSQAPLEVIGILEHELCRDAQRRGCVRGGGAGAVGSRAAGLAGGHWVGVGLSLQCFLWVLASLLQFVAACCSERRGVWRERFRWAASSDSRRCVSEA
jgi:hypothetical protein